MKRYIALVDCDSFFVACEQSVNPELKGKPVCVLSNNDGCVVSRSREAKKMGIKMGMPYFMAKREFPKGIYVSGNHEIYREFSHRVMECLKQFSPDVQIYSIDEAFIDLTGTKKLYKRNYVEIVKMIKSEIKKETDIDVSIGLSLSKTLSKLASDKAKNTGGIYVIGSRKIIKEMKNTRVEEIWGVGRNIHKFLQKWGILMADDFVSRSDEWLKSNLGKTAVELKHELSGDSISPVIDKYEPPKSIQDTSAIGEFTSDINTLKTELSKHIHSSCVKLRRHNGVCSTVGVMLRTKDFIVYTKRKVLLQPTNFELTIQTEVSELLKEIYSPQRIYRSTGIMLENLSYSEGHQLFLFNSEFEKTSKLAKSIDNIEKKFGKNAITTGFINN